MTVEIEDDGPGLPENEVALLTSETETPLVHSTGTGLWLTRWIVRTSGGRIAVDSGRFDGTRVRLELPRAAQG